jgi:uncharacterized protein YbjT (DUF2867 family)
MKKTALITGASGLVGSFLLQLLLQSENYEKVIAVGRKPLGISHTKLEEIITDFNDPKILHIPCDDVFCCMGSTMRNAGSKAAFMRIDHDIPLQLAAQTKAAGAKQFVLISAMGSNSKSAIFYNRVKGILEADLKLLEFGHLVLVKPSMLLGPRKEKRLGETIGKAVMQLLAPIIPKKYKAVQASAVANAMLLCANNGVLGLEVADNARIIDMA